MNKNIPEEVVYGRALKIGLCGRSIKTIDDKKENIAKKKTR